MLITGGEEATPHEYPWMAALFFEQGAGNTYFCGGTLVMQLPGQVSSSKDTKDQFSDF